MDDHFPAFPLVVPREWGAIHDGMTLRDWFAGQALVGLLGGRDEGCTFTVGEAARKSYAVAQALLAERRRYESDD